MIQVLTLRRESCKICEVAIFLLLKQLLHMGNYHKLNIEL